MVTLLYFLVFHQQVAVLVKWEEMVTLAEQVAAVEPLAIIKVALEIHLLFHPHKAQMVAGEAVRQQVAAAAVVLTVLQAEIMAATLKLAALAVLALYQALQELQQDMLAAARAAAHKVTAIAVLVLVAVVLVLPLAHQILAVVVLEDMEVLAQEVVLVW
jgi:hypothetical protein